MITIKKLFIGALTFVMASSSIAQNGDNNNRKSLLPNFNEFSPEVASLGKYGSCGVSEYTGIPDIKIPLFTMESGTLSIPVYLYYDASGIKVNQEATFVGLGWNLSYGGCISHIVCGKDDYLGGETYHTFNEAVRGENPYSHSVKPFSINNPISVLRQNYTNEFGDVVYYYEPSPSKLSDKESQLLQSLQNLSLGYYLPDIFQASFCGHSVSFVIDPETRQPVTIGDDATKYKIEIELPGSGHPVSFTITDDKGIIYFFKAFDEYRGIRDSYYLTKVTKGNSTIEFTYKQESVYHLPGFHESVGQAIYGEVTLNKIIDSTYIRKNKSWNFSNYQMKKVYPQKIITQQDTISFCYTKREDLNGGKKIDMIKVTSLNGNKTIHNIKLNYDYFIEQKSGTLFEENAQYIPKRLKLTNVNIDGKKYSFSYNKENKLPYRSSLSQDFWGYYNGVNNQYGFCTTPHFKITSKGLESVITVGGANRYCSQANCDVGILNKIIYPTGGYTEFEYEVNQFTDTDGYYYNDASNYAAVEFNPLSSLNPMVNIKKVPLGTARYIPGTPDTIRSVTFTLDKTRQVRIHIGGCCKIDKYFSKVSIVGPGINFEEKTTSNNSFDRDFDTVLSAGKYTMTAITTGNIDRQYTGQVYAVISAEYEDSKPLDQSASNSENANANNSDKYVSIGAGLRIKSIKNYSEKNIFFSGTNYKYEGGKLLIPTVRAQYKHITYTNNIDDNNDKTEYIPHDVTSSFYFTCSEPSYSPICTLGIPNVGYTTVRKEDIDSKGTVHRTTITDYINEGYILVAPGYLDLDFHFSNEGLNGKISSTKILSSDMKSETTYKYAKKYYETVMYPLCQSQFYNNKWLRNFPYTVSFYPKRNVWHYLTEKKETLYDSKGNKTTSNTTSFKYDPTNYQLSDLSVTDGTNTSRTLYSYPASNTLRFMQHILSEVDGVETYRNGTFTGGSKYIYTTHKNPQTGVSFPVVQKCNSVLPNASKSNVTEMTVTSYDDYGNIREYKKKDGTPVTIIWSYNHQFPIMEIVGSTYTEVCNKVKDKINDKSKYIPSLETASSVDEDTMSSIHNILREGSPNTLVTAYTYSPWHSVSQIIKPNGDKVKYNYDQYGRLEKTSDINDNILQKYTYNYKKEK